MLNITNGEEHGHDHDDEYDDYRHRHRDSADEIRDIHPLTSPVPTNRGRPRDPSWETISYRSTPSEGGSFEASSTMSREFSALVVAGSELGPAGGASDGGNGNALLRIREEEETNPLAIVPDRSDPLGDPEPEGRRGGVSGASGTTSSRGSLGHGGGGLEVSVERVKKEEVEAKITAWQTAKIEKINNRFKREDAVISGWESERVQKSTSWMKKVERKLEEKRARAMEKTQNEMAQAHRKAEERRAAAEAKRATKAAKILELANLMRVVGRPPAKRSFF